MLRNKPGRMGGREEERASNGLRGERKGRSVGWVMIPTWRRISISVAGELREIG